MASSRSSSLLPYCTSCIQRFTRQNWDFRSPRQTTRGISKRAKAEGHTVVVKLLKDVPRFGPAGSYVPLNPSTMRNRWFPGRVADYVPITQVKQLKAQNIDIVRNFEYGVELALEEEEDEETDPAQQPKHYVRPIEIDILSPGRSMELLNTFIPPTIDFYRQPIEKDKEPVERIAASGAADILSAVVMGSKAKSSVDTIYGSVSAADVVSTIKGALAHNDEAARVILNEADVRFISGHEEGDTSRVKQLGTFKVEIQLPGFEKPMVRSIRVRAKDSKS